MGRASKKKATSSGASPSPDGVIMAKPVSEQEIDRRLRPVLEALMSNRPKQAMKLCNQAITKRPGWPAARALRACGMLSLGQRDEAFTAVEEIRADLDAGRVPLDEDAASKLTMFYRDARRIEMAAEVYEHAWQAEPNKVVNGEVAFSLYVRAHRFAEAQRTAIRLHRTVPSKAVTYTMLMACASWLDIQLKKSAPISLEFDPRVLKLASLRVFKVFDGLGPSHMEVVRFAIRLFIDAEEFNCARSLLNQPGLLVARNEHMRLSALIEKRSGNREAAAQLYQKFVLELDPDDWNSWTEFFDLGDLSSEGNTDCWAGIEAACEIAEDPRTKNRLRAPFLAKMEALMRENRTEELRDEIVEFFGRFSSRNACAGDLRPFVGYLVLKDMDDNLFSLLKSAATEAGDPCSDLTVCWLELWCDRLDLSADELMERYRASIEQNSGTVGNRLAGDDYALLAAHKLLPHRKDRYADKSAVLKTILLLEEALTRNPHSSYFKLALVLLCMEVKHTARAFEVWTSLEIKHVQLANLSFLVLDDLFSVADRDGLLELFTMMQNLWREMDTEIPNALRNGFANGSFNTAVNIVLLQHRLKRSAFLFQSVLVEALTSLNRPGADIAAVWRLVGEGGRFQCDESEAAEGLTYGPDMSVLEFWNIADYDPNDRLKDERDDGDSELGQLVSPGLQSAVFSEMKALRRVLALVLAKDDDVSITADQDSASLELGESGDPHMNVTEEHLTRAKCMECFSTLLVSLKQQLSDAMQVREFAGQLAIVTKFLRDETQFYKGQQGVDEAIQFFNRVPDILGHTGTLIGYILVPLTLGIESVHHVLMQKVKHNRKSSNSNPIVVSVEKALVQLRTPALDVFESISVVLCMILGTKFSDLLELPEDRNLVILMETICESHLTSAQRLLQSVQAMVLKLKQECGA